ncbi:uncharacterized protein LOC143033942 isoform X1 [Oratosquilla oratoria]|uniref:uncharacterized protein LOC143033942 isoform X1 n=1 Tax=Oratosquilla oratoria TaxID=337810 RepID=UPI003F75DBEE
MPRLMSGLTLLEAELTLHAIFQQLTQYITSSAAQIFRHRQIPSKYRDFADSEPPHKGHKVDASREEAFLLAIEDLVSGNDDEQTTVVDLVDRMSQLCPDVEAYSVKYMKQKLISYFGDELVISNVRGRSDVVTVKETAAKILQQFKDSPQTDDEEAEKR